ncbi:MAG: DUF302 domain-containing protein [Proteobacteria bacterium]|nr:DUF302 domain-containing protein [Pseudomonadota bacterium]
MTTADRTDGSVISVASNSGFAATLDKLVALIEANGLRVFARIDHAANATEVGMTLRPTTLVIFGNPKGGTPLMQDRQTAGLDLPLRILVWQDEVAKVWLTWGDPQELIARHHLSDASASVLDTIAKGVIKLAQAAAQ